MPKLKIKERTPGRNSRYKAGQSPYIEFVFSRPYRSLKYDGAGGMILAMGLDRKGRVRALVYHPSFDADMDEARQMAKLRMMADVPELSKVKFSPFWPDVDFIAAWKEKIRKERSQ